MGKYTNEFLEMVDEGIISKDYAIVALVNYLSEDDFYEVMRLNDLLQDDEDEDEDED